ncbi:putative WUSCHEL-related homeobox 2 [Impatiens glandulifera]|uniref:putative WUSCHEL-related homeobox 2 n=1 Tax=Impatiens glandulifera TaxID=253017 RepID=UPI001FB13E32|nr:putative WUSCHEL-related homeobox 2 [Impatiens glandulifera]
MEDDYGTRVLAWRRRVNSRWRPTREQVSMLENLYMQGMRRPTDEQTQQIINRLKTCSGSDAHIKGSSIFYWFQNHKTKLKKQFRRHLEEQQALSHAHAHAHAFALAHAHANFINSSICNTNANATARATPVTLTLFPLEPSGNLRAENNNNNNAIEPSCSRPIIDLD